MHRAAERREEFGCDGGGGSVGAIQHDAFAAEIESRDYLAEEGLVVVAVARLDGNWRSLLQGRMDMSARRRKISFSISSSCSSGSL